MKSITATTYNAKNYGAVLQAFALQRIQKEVGIDNYLLGIPEGSRIYARFPHRLNRRFMIVLAMNLGAFLHRKKIKKLYAGFNSFLEKNLICTEPYLTLEELREKPPKADFYINGSDQVFGLRSEWSGQRMLDFGSQDIPRYSYAASLEEYDWDQEEKIRFKKLINKFGKVSVREKYAKKYLESFIEMDCQVHMDPVFMLDKEQWEKMAIKPQIDQPYILVFPLLGNKHTQELADRVKELTNYKIVCIQTMGIKRMNSDLVIMDATPQEFLGWMKYAATVITTSFHGTAFSIIFNKPFYTLIKDYKAQRITDLLETLHLSDRLYNGGELTSVEEIDFSYADEVIDREKEECREYFREIAADCIKRKNYD